MQLVGNLDLPLVQAVEGLALRAWPALEIVEDDGWLLRFASGITRRANSVWPNELAGESASAERLARVEAFYHRRGLHARFQICPATQPPQLDEMLARRGYRAVARTAVQCADIAILAACLGDATLFEVEIVSQPTVAWWMCYAAADAVAPDSVAVRQQICAAIQPPTAYASVTLDSEVVAVGSAVVEQGWVGLFNIATLSQHRRKGAAQALIAALVEWAQAQGATQAYLQVMTDNESALRLYSRLGFTTGYYYHYREERLA